MYCANNLYSFHLHIEVKNFGEKIWGFDVGACKVNNANSSCASFRVIRETKKYPIFRYVFFSIVKNHGLERIHRVVLVENRQIEVRTNVPLRNVEKTIQD